jgi:hypothetical protein
MECCGDDIVAVILDGECMEGENSDYIFVVDWRIGRITQACSPTTNSVIILTQQPASKVATRNVWCSGHLSVP